MKVRYFMIPLIIISFMALIISKETKVENRHIFLDNSEINYPFFGNSTIDSYINNYLNNTIKENQDIIIDYDYLSSNDDFYLTFYKSLIQDGKINSASDSFLISPKTSQVSRISEVNYEYDAVQNRFFDNSKKLVALTFDDGPNYNTNKVLDILEKYDVRATFFVLGSRIKGNEYLLKRMAKDKMEIGNHTFNHLLLTKYKEDKIKEEIDSTSNLIYEVTGKHPTLLRPSYGSFNKKIKKLSSAPIIIWDIDTLDWKYHNSKKIASRVLNKVKDGDIILMHDIYTATANSLNTIIPELQKRGYEFVTIPELFYYKEIALEKGKVYGYAR